MAGIHVRPWWPPLVPRGRSSACPHYSCTLISMEESLLQDPQGPGPIQSFLRKFGARPFPGPGKGAPRLLCALFSGSAAPGFGGVLC